MSNTPSIVQTQQPQTPDMDLLRNIGTGDLKKTEETYKKVGLRYEKPPQQLKEEKWYAQVTNQNTNKFFQPEHLKAAGLVPKTTKIIRNTREVRQKHFRTFKLVFIRL